MKRKMKGGKVGRMVRGYSPFDPGVSSLISFEHDLNFV